MSNKQPTSAADYELNVHRNAEFIREAAARALKNEMMPEPQWDSLPEKARANWLLAVDVVEPLIRAKVIEELAAEADNRAIHLPAQLVMDVPWRAVADWLRSHTKENPDDHS
jgi:hypothetical protein